MSQTDVYYLASFYPLMPSDSIDAEIGKIKNIRIGIELPAREYVPSDRGCLEFYADLLQIEAGIATFHVVCSPFGIDKTIELPVISEADGVASSVGFIVADRDTEIPAGNYRVHPDCLHFTQKAVRISVEERKPANSDESAVGTSEIIGMTGDLRISDGRNMSVSGNGGEIVFTGGPGFGLGAYSTSPWPDVDDQDLIKGGTRGLRSINGQTGDVRIAGSGSVWISGGTAITVKIDPAEITGDAE